MKAFLHNYTEPISANEMNEICGFTKAMESLYTALSEMTELKPEKRMVDAVDLLNMITATNADLQPLMQSFKARLETRSSNDRNTLETTHY